MNAKILIVEDEPTIRELLAFNVTQAGFRALCAEDADSAWQQIRSNVPDLILLDIMLPEVDGYTILNKMAQKPELANVPVIVVTAKPMMSDLFMMSKNVKHFFAKPFNTKLLREKVKEIIG